MTDVSTDPASLTDPSTAQDTPQGLRDASATPVPVDIIQVRMVCWAVKDSKPKMRMISVPKGDKLRLYESKWVQRLCDSTFMDVWSDEEQDWNTLRVDTATVRITPMTTAVLLRCREAKTCPGLGLEVQLLEQSQGQFCFAKPQEFDLTRKAASGRTVRVFTWAEGPREDPMVYRISLTPEDTFSILTTQALLKASVGEEDGSGEAPTIEVWDLACYRWLFKKIGEDIKVDRRCDIVLVRNRRNRRPIGLGYRLEELEEEIHTHSERQMTHAMGEDHSRHLATKKRRITLNRPGNVHPGAPPLPRRTMEQLFEDATASARLRAHGEVSSSRAGRGRGAPPPAEAEIFDLTNLSDN